MKIVSCAHLKKLKMNRFLKVISSLALAVTIFACNKDDDSASFAPPRAYAVQYAMDKDSIKKYLETHYVASVDADYNVDIKKIEEGQTHTPIWQMPELLNKPVTQNGVEYTIYYLMLNEGTGDRPTKYDNVKVAYRGTLLDNTEFDVDPFPQGNFSLLGYIEGWREIIPLFRAGNLIDIPDNPNPAAYENFGAGVMFLPSDFGYYETPRAGIPAYSPLIFSFKLYSVEYADHDGDGILTKDETVPGTDPAYYDTDGDGIPNYLDVDDDNDGYTTKSERIIYNPDPNAEVQYYAFENIPLCPGGTLKRHLDPSCHKDN